MIALSWASFWFQPDLALTEVTEDTEVLLRVLCGLCEKPWRT